jgi:hypothetical protein
LNKKAANSLRQQALKEQSQKEKGDNNGVTA